MKKIIFFTLLVCIHYNLRAQTGGIFTNNTSCNVEVGLLATSSGLGYGCAQLRTNTVIVPGLGGVVAWNHICSPSFPGWAVGADPFLSGTCPTPSVDPAFTWTDAFFIFHCPTPCQPVRGQMSDASVGCTGFGTSWILSFCSGTFTGTYSTALSGVILTFN